MALTFPSSLAKALIGGLMLVSATLPAPAMAQRDPAYEAARKAGQVGEKTDGFLGVVGNQPPAIQRLVDDINIRRRANYADRAQAQNATLEEYAITQGCLLIERTQPGEKYQGRDGSWKTRGAEPPERDPRCP